MRLVPSPPVASTARAIVASALHRATTGPSRCGRTAEVFALASLRRLSLSRLRFDLPALSNSGSRYSKYSGSGYSVVTDLRRLLKRHRLLDARHHHNRHPGRGERLVYLSLGRCQLSGARRLRTILDFDGHKPPRTYRQTIRRPEPGPARIQAVPTARRERLANLTVIRVGTLHVVAHGITSGSR